jgi:hypothetical protein
MSTKDEVYRIEYYACVTEDKPGEGAKLGKRLAQEGVNLVGLSAFPVSPGKTQVDLVPENHDQLVKAAKKHGIPLSGPKTCFLLQGTDRTGAMGEVLGRLGNAGINARASLGVCAGGKRYGGLIWVAAGDVEGAARALGATSMATHKV